MTALSSTKKRTVTYNPSSHLTTAKYLNLDENCWMHYTFQPAREGNQMLVGLRLDYPNGITSFVDLSGADFAAARRAAGFTTSVERNRFKSSVNAQLFDMDGGIELLRESGGTAFDQMLSKFYAEVESALAMRHAMEDMKETAIVKISEQPTPVSIPSPFPRVVPGGNYTEQFASQKPGPVKEALKALKDTKLAFALTESVKDGKLKEKFIGASVDDPEQARLITDALNKFVSRIENELHEGKKILFRFGVMPDANDPAAKCHIVLGCHNKQKINHFEIIPFDRNDHVLWSQLSNEGHQAFDRLRRQAGDIAMVESYTGLLTQWINEAITATKRENGAGRSGHR